MKRIFPNQAEAIANSLYAILVEKKRASRVLEKCIDEHPKWGSRDRKILYEACFNILRWKRKYYFIAAQENGDFTPWPLIKTWCILHDYTLPDWDELDCPPYQSKSELNDLLISDEAIAHSYPDWLYHLGKKELKQEWRNEASALNFQADVALRVNRLVASPKKTVQLLKERFNIDTTLSDLNPDTLLLSKGRRLGNNQLFQKGYFEIQDANSQLIAPFCQVEPGMYVMDLCAGAGGKTLHLAALMRNQGEIKAFDVEANKLRELHRRSKRAKVSIIKTELITSTSTLEKHTKWADRLLVDAPCSGLGTLKRNPEIKWNLDEGQLIAYQETQRKLLSKAAPLIQPKGKLIYATCSILPSENENQIDWFIKENPEFKLEEEIKISADSSKFDGFYMARLTRE